MCEDIRKVDASGGWGNVNITERRA